MRFKEIVKEHTEIYFDNKDDLEEFLELCTENNLNWIGGDKANYYKGIYNSFEGYGNYIVIHTNKGKCLTQNNNKVDFTYNDFKKLLNLFDLAEFLKDNAVNVKDEQQFNDMYSLLKDNNVLFGYDWKEHYYIFRINSCISFEINRGTKVTDRSILLNIISYQDFISTYNSNNIKNKKVEELTKQSLKQDVEMYLIKDKEATNSYNDLLEFIININNKYDLRLNL